MRTAVGIAVAGALGTLARYSLEGLVADRVKGPFPWGTFTVNVTGSLVLGFLFTLTTERLAIAPWIRSSVLIGFLGAYTTFSTLSLETFRLVQEGSYLTAALNAAGSLLCGLAAVYVGIVVGRAV